MNALPSSWATVGIEETLLPFENGQTLRQGWSPQCENFPAKTENDWGVLKTTAIQDGEFQPEHNKQLPTTLEPDPLLEVEPGDLLLTCAGPRVRCGVICLVRKTRSRLMISGKMYRFRADPKLALATYLEAFLRSHDTKKRIDELKTGISDSGLNLTLARFKTLRVPLPPLAEQHRIVAKIEELFSELDKATENLKQARAQLTVYRQALLKHAFEGKLTETWRKAHSAKLRSADQLFARIKAQRQARYQQLLAEWEATSEGSASDTSTRKKPAKPQKPRDFAPLSSDELEDLPRIPANWCYLKVGDVCDVVRGGSPRPAGDPHYYGGNIPFLKVADLTQKPGVYLTSFEYTIKEAGLSKTRFVTPPTLMISNSGATLGVPKICTIEATFNDGIAAFLGLSQPEQLYHYYYWEGKTRHLRAINQGAAQPNLNTTLLQDQWMPYCCEEEMAALTSELEKQLSALTAMASDFDTNLQKAEALRQSILKKAFDGELVPQDLHDEPASELLARIKAARAAQAQQPKKEGRAFPARRTRKPRTNKASKHQPELKL